MVKKTQYILPIITDVLRRRKGCEFLTKLDIHINDVLYISLDEEAQKMCTIVTPVGPFKMCMILLLGAQKDLSVA